MHTLHLTTAEIKIFSALPADIRGNDTPQTEVLTFEDSPRRRSIRFELFHPTDPEILRFRDAAAKAKTDADFAAIAEKIDMKKIGDEQLTQLLFTMGPSFLGIIIADLLSSAKTADDVELITAFSALRHGMLESLNLYSPKEP